MKKKLCDDCGIDHDPEYHDRLNRFEEEEREFPRDEELDPIVKCLICNQTFKTERLLETHARKEHPTVFESGHTYYGSVKYPRKQLDLFGQGKEGKE